MRSAGPTTSATLSLIAPSGIGRQNHSLLAKAALLLVLGEWGRRRALRLVSGSVQLPPEVAEFVVAIFRHFRPRMERLPLRTDEELAGLSMPVQLILGRHDAMIHSAETRERMERLTANLHLTWLEDAGHILGGQAARVLDFLGQNPEPPLPRQLDDRVMRQAAWTDRVRTGLSRSPRRLRRHHGDAKDRLDQQLLEALAHDPATLRRTWQSVKEIMAPGELDALTKEMVYLAVSASTSAAIASRRTRPPRARPA